jgi:hypothetical protein
MRSKGRRVKIEPQSNVAQISGNKKSLSRDLDTDARGF